MIQRLLWFQFVRLGRILREGGWRLLLLVPFLALALGAALLRLTSLHPALFQGLCLGVLIAIHFARRDAGFLRLLGRKGRLYCVLEYSLWLLPLQAFFLLRISGNDRLWALPVLLLLPLLHLLPPGMNLRLRSGPRPGKMLTSRLPAGLYEWKALLRRYFGFLALFYLTTLAALPWLPVASIFIAVTALFFSGVPEWEAPPEVLLRSGKDPLTRKMRQNAGFLAALLLPLMALQIVFHPHLTETLVLLYVFVVAQLLCLYFLLLPYADFPQPLSRGRLLVHMLLFCLLAPLLPASLYLLYRQYQKALWNLRPYWS